MKAAALADAGVVVAAINHPRDKRPTGVASTIYPFPLNGLPMLSGCRR